MNGGSTWIHGREVADFPEVARLEDAPSVAGLTARSRGAAGGVVVAVDEVVLRRCTGRHGQQLEGRSGKRQDIRQGQGLEKAHRPLVKAVMELR